VAVSANQNILWFEITVNDACCMQAFDAFDDFGGVEPGPVSA
jgi:hypothetical protein